MKRFIFELNERFHSYVFQDGRFKLPKELMKLCINICRELQYYTPLPMENDLMDKIILIVNNMSRLFFFTKNKYVSISLPVSIYLTPDGNPEFTCNAIPLNAEYWSRLICLCEEPLEVMINEKDFSDFLLKCNNVGVDFLQIYHTFYNFDYGYIRYDIDSISYNEASKKGRPHKHPKYHFDINIANASTFKTGCLNKIEPMDFINFLDNQEDRWYVLPPTHKFIRNLKRK